MIGFAETLGAISGSFLLPAFIALLISSAAARFLRPMYLAAFAIGLYLWFFSDTIGDTSLLGVSEGFTGGVWHAALWVCFALGLLLVVSFDKSTFAEGGAGERLGFAIPVLVAIAVGLHGFGEGAAIGATAATTPNTSLLYAFGGFSAAGAFILHKGLEPVMVGAAYWVYAKDRERGMNSLVKDLLVLTLAFALPGIIGGAGAYYLVQVYPSSDFTYVFALGLGASIYAAARLVRPLFQTSGSSSESIKMALSLILGFTCLYLAALLHS